MTEKKPASAGNAPVVNPPALPIVVKNVSLTRLPLVANKPSHPVAIYKGTAPNVGDVIEFTLKNGVTYRGSVADATAADGEVMVEFSAPLIVLPKE